MKEAPASMKSPRRIANRTKAVLISGLSKRNIPNPKLEAIRTLGRRAKKDNGFLRFVLVFLACDFLCSSFSFEHGF
jgi:hypothetical protein